MAVDGKKRISLVYVCKPFCLICDHRNDDTFFTFSMSPLAINDKFEHVRSAALIDKI